MTSITGRTPGQPQMQQMPDHPFAALLAVIDGGPSRICGVEVNGERCGKRAEEHVSGNDWVAPSPVIYDVADRQKFTELQALASEPLHPELLPYVEEGALGKMIRHPLVYDLAFLPGQTNRAYMYKKRLLSEYLAYEDWAGIVWLHERPYRLKALIDYCTGRNDEGEIIPLVSTPEHWDLAAHIWTDSENIAQVNDEWRALICQPGEYPTGLWLGDRPAFDALPWIDDTIVAYRGGAVGDWSWTTDIKTAEFFSRQSGHPVRTTRVHRDDCFGYLTNRREFELLVTLTDERYPLVYPDGESDG